MFLTNWRLFAHMLLSPSPYTPPSGVPFVYQFTGDKGGKLTPVKPADGSLCQIHTNGKFLEKPGSLQEALKQQKEWKRNVPGLASVSYDGNAEKRRTNNMEDSLIMLRQDQNADKLIVDTVTKGIEVVDGEEVQLVVTSLSSNAIKDTFDDPSEFEDFMEDDAGEGSVAANIVPLAEGGQSGKDPVVVFIRHGRTPHNNLGLFTGWEDPPLAPDGVEDAKNAGILLKRHGFKFDVVYSSWLQRALQTAWYVIDELDMLHLPLIKSWRLNERMYGALTGKSKAMVANEYGEEQLTKWRRGFKIRPPAVSSYSLNYPGNDYSRTKYVKDLRVSWSETINRSWEERKFRIHRKFPKHESLHDCMQRSVS
jgi:2,3-bisphosphoglycerate-dependent phosphoglycerate mutase